MDKPDSWLSLSRTNQTVGYLTASKSRSTYIFNKGDTLPQPAIFIDWEVCPKKNASCFCLCHQSQHKQCCTLSKRTYGNPRSLLNLGHFKDILRECLHKIFDWDILYKKLQRSSTYFGGQFYCQRYTNLASNSLFTQSLRLSVDPPNVHQIQVAYENHEAPGKTFSIMSSSLMALEGNKQRESA